MLGMDMKYPENPFTSVVKALRLVTVEPYLFFCLFGYSIRLVTFQSLLMDRACRNLHMFSDDICNQIEKHEYQQALSIEAGNNLYAGVMLLSSLPAVVVAIFLGPWSDKYSRKYPLIIAASGMFLEGAASAGLVMYPSLSPWWFVATSFFAGISGGFIMSTSAAFSYVSDVTVDRSRAARYAVLEFSNISAIVAGNLLGGELFKGKQFLPSMVLAPCAFAVAILYTVFFVEETRTRTPEQTCSVMVRDLVTLDNIKDSYRTCSRRREGNIRLQIWLLVWVSCSQKFMDMGTLAVSYPYTNQMYKWDVTAFSQASTAFYVVNAFVTVAIVPILSNKFRLHEAALGLVGMLSLTSKMVVTSVAYSEPLFYFGWMSGTLNNAAGIAIRARLSKLVNKDELGRAFSLLGTCESVTPLLGTLAFVQMYNASVHFFPGLPFAVSAVLLIPSLLIFYWMMDLPTISVGSFGSTDENNGKPMETFSTDYKHLEEEKF